MKKVLCAGCFDILHAGHLEYFKEAKSYGDYLIVSVTADKYVNKGPQRPYFSEQVRAGMLKALSIVDEVYICDEATQVTAINKFKPDFYVKGQDYADKSKDITGGIIEEEKAVKACGGALIFTKTSMCSSSTLANRFFIARSDEQMKTIDTIKELGGMDKIRSYLADISKLKVCVIGEPIIDTYRFVEPQNISSKSPSISCKYLNEESYNGGAKAIANHIQYGCGAETKSMWPKGSKYPEKIRYVHDNNKIFEVTKIDEIVFSDIDDQEMFVDSMIFEANESDVTILSDFGHGLFEYEVLSACENIKSFVSLNVQTNSSNYGFNTYQKHKRWDYLVLDKRELQLAFHDNKTNAVELGNVIARRESKNVSITLGSNGSCYYANKSDWFEQFKAPAFADQVIDATGAGDAYFAITSLLVKVNANPQFIPFIGNVFAGLKTKIIGNKEPVSKASLMKALESILK